MEMTINITRATTTSDIDRERDIQAGLNAKMITVTAGFGYIDADDNPRAWPADYFVERGEQLLPLLKTL